MTRSTHLRPLALLPTLALGLLLPLASTTPAHAQGKDGEKSAKRKDERGRRGRRGRRGWRGGMDLKDMKKKLGLSAEQVTKFEALQKEQREAMRKGWEEMRKRRESGERPDRDAMRKRFQDARKAHQKKIDAILTPKQRKQFKKYQEKRRGRRGRWGGRINAEQQAKRLKAAATKILALSQEEQAVIGKLLDDVLESRKLLMGEGEKRRKAFLQAIRETEDEAKLTKLLAEYRKARANDRLALKRYQSKLREVLTPVQEAKLVALNILD